MKRLTLATLAALAVAQPISGDEAAQPVTFFHERFDDARLVERGWYDGDRFTISDEKPFAGGGCLEYAWKAATTTPFSSSGVRRAFDASERVFLRFRIRLSKNWAWTDRPYHPHLMHFMTTENGKFHGPAASHLTLYIEPWNGKLRLGAQDIQNKDKPGGLTQGPLRGGFNGRLYDSREILFSDDDWHLVEAQFQLNTVDAKNNQVNADGIVRGWFDGSLVIDRNDIVLRSADFPAMKFNQFLMLPYFGPGLLKRAQTLWIDELMVATDRPNP